MLGEFMEELKHIAIIMDGNGRWAKKRGLNRSLGHREGSKQLENICIHAKKIGIPFLSVYAFSTENFKRSKEEVDYLMNLFIEMFNKNFKKLDKEDIKVVFSGRRENLRDDVLESMDFITEKTKNNTGMTLNICLNYGGQSEIVDASKKIVKDILDNKISMDDINIDLYSKYLYQDLPPIDLLIRTSGEYRISNFMLWQMSYSEFYFTDTLFPDFNSDELDKAIDSYYNRDRKFGGIKDEK
jgi:undecaprenyl diphosphate synthase